MNSLTVIQEGALTYIYRHYFRCATVRY